MKLFFLYHGIKEEWLAFALVHQQGAVFSLFSKGPSAFLMHETYSLDTLFCPN